LPFIVLKVSASAASNAISGPPYPDDGKDMRKWSEETIVVVAEETKEVEKAARTKEKHQHRMEPPATRRAFEPACTFMQ